MRRHRHAGNHYNIQSLSTLSSTLDALIRWWTLRRLVRICRALELNIIATTATIVVVRGSVWWWRRMVRIVVVRLLVLVGVFALGIGAVTVIGRSAVVLRRRMTWWRAAERPTGAAVGLVAHSSPSASRDASGWRQ